MGLRLNDGVDLTRLPDGGVKYTNNINGLVDIGVLSRNDNWLKTTVAGRPVLNAVLRQLLDD